MSRMQRTKGIAWERDVIRTAIAFGLSAEHPAAMQARDGSATYSDVIIDGLRCECKHHAVIPQWVTLVNCALLNIPFAPKRIIAGWLGDHDALILKRTGGWTPLVVRPINPSRCTIIRPAPTPRCTVTTLADFLAARQPPDTD